MNKQNSGEYIEDGRLSWKVLYQAYGKLVEAGWDRIEITRQRIVYQGKDLEFPIYAYISHPHLNRPTNTFWVLSGVHGEEPAGPIALAKETTTLIQLAKQIPVICIPLLNPASYFRDWRYENERRDSRVGQSVTDSEWLLSANRAQQFQADIPPSATAQSVVGWVVTKLELYQPLIVFDHHEDELAENSHFEESQQFSSYVYSYGNRQYDEIVEQVVQILLDNGTPVVMNGMTRWQEVIENGVVHNSSDGSIDELMVAKSFIYQGHGRNKVPAKVAVVVETTRGVLPLTTRVKAHQEIIRHYAEFVAQVDNQTA